MSTLAAEEEKKELRNFVRGLLWGTSLSGGLHPGAELGSATRSRAGIELRTQESSNGGIYSGIYTAQELSLDVYPDEKNIYMKNEKRGKSEMLAYHSFALS